MTTKPSFQMGHSAPLDGLRGISIILVMVAHIQILVPSMAGYFTGGFLGVDVFFVVSGFLITYLLLNEQQSSRQISLRNFYIRRALRLLPALVVIVTLVCLLGFALGSLSFVGLSGIRLLSIAGYFTNWLRVFEVPRPWLLGHFWSLAVEEQFYLIWPVLLVFLFRLRQARTYILVLLIAGILGSLVLKAWLYMNGATPQRLIFGSDTRAEPILFGCLLAVLLHWEKMESLSRYRNGLSIVGLFVALTIIAFTDQDSSLIYFGGFTLFSLAICAIIFKVVTDRTSRLSLQLSSGWLVWVGQRSYGIYLWHWPIFKLVQSFPLPSHIFVPLAVTTTLVIAGISYRYIETPFLKLKERFTLPRNKATAAVPSLHTDDRGLWVLPEARST